MVLLGTAMLCSRQTTVVSGTVWPQSAMQVLTEDCILAAKQRSKNVRSWLVQRQRREMYAILVIYEH